MSDQASSTAIDIFFVNLVDDQAVSGDANLNTVGHTR